MHKILKSIISVLLITAVLFSTVTASPTANADCDNSAIDSSSLSNEVRSFLNASDYYAGQFEVEQYTASIRIWNNDDRVCFSLTPSTMVIGKKHTFWGNVFALHGNGYYDDKLIVGDFPQVEMLNIVQFRILNEGHPVLTLLVEHMDTGKLIEYSFQISEDVFHGLMEIALANTAATESTMHGTDNQLSQMLTAQRILALMETPERLVNGGNVPRTQNHSSFQSTSTYSGTYATSLEVKNFCTAVNNSTTSGITPSTMMQTVLSQTGWKLYKANTYFYVMYGVATSSDVRYIGITIASVSNNHPEQTKLSASYTIIGSTTVAYNTSTHIATLIMYDAGIRLEDATIAIELLNDTTNFYQATKTWSYTDNTSGLKDILIAISDYLGIASAIWNALQTSNNSSETVDFGNDSNQINVFGGLVRAVANQLKSGYYLWNSGDSVGIIGCHYNTNQKPYSSHRIAWSFTGYSLV